MAAAFLMLVTAAPALAQSYQCAPPARIEPTRPARQDGPTRRVPVASYVLAASWTPEYCRGDSQSMQCSGRNGRFGFILHGLWPEARNGPPPQWCATTPRPSPELIRRNLCMTPVPWLIEHEWAKHGSCMTRTPEAYLRTSAILWRSLRWPDADRLSRLQGFTAGQFREAFVAANPAWKREQIGLLVNSRGWLREVQLCYGRDFLPRACPRRTFGPGDSAPLKIWRGM